MSKTIPLYDQAPLQSTEPLHIHDPTKDKTYTFSQSMIHIGSDSDNDIILLDPHISKTHARLVRSVAKKWILEDLQSTNGTYLNHRSVLKAFVQPGDTITFANTHLIITSPSKTHTPNLVPFLHTVKATCASDKLKQLFIKAHLFAQTRENICVFGETGSGKDVIARFIHAVRYKNNTKIPFLSINMSTLPENLIEFELFGAKKGSFTGSQQDSLGIFESAKEGTVFLDEIGDMPLHLQPKILRTLENKEIRRIGESMPRSVKCSFIFATHQNLKTQIKEKKFREDLYHRICVLPLTLLPLRERAGDVLALSQTFMPNTVTLSEEAKSKIMSHSFPGNVRELKNIITRAVILTEAKNQRTITADEVLFV